MGTRMGLEIALRYPEIQNEQNKIYIREDGEVKRISASGWRERYPNLPPPEVAFPELEVFCCYIPPLLAEVMQQLGVDFWTYNNKKAAELAEPSEGAFRRLLDEEYAIYKEWVSSRTGMWAYEHLVQDMIEAAEDLVRACIQHPDADLVVRRC